MTAPTNAKAPRKWTAKWYTSENNNMLILTNGDAFEYHEVIEVIEASYAKELEAEIERLKAQNERLKYPGVASEWIKQKGDQYEDTIASLTAAFERLKSERDAAVFLLDKIANHVPHKNATILERAIVEAYAIEARAVLASLSDFDKEEKK